jgi:hypothetical protein
MNDNLARNGQTFNGVDGIVYTLTVPNDI